MMAQLLEESKRNYCEISILPKLTQIKSEINVLTPSEDKRPSITNFCGLRGFYNYALVRHFFEETSIIDINT